jgi:hypothetical protein
MEEKKENSVTGKGILWSLIASALFGWVVYSSQINRSRMAEGISIYSATKYENIAGVKTGKVSKYAYESIYLNDTLLRLFDADTNKVVDAVYWERNWPACDGKFGVDSFSYQKAQELNQTGPEIGCEYGQINFKINKNTIDLATKIYNSPDTSERKETEWRKDVRNLVQRINADYESMSLSK